jgi:hypothetical protein
VIMPKTMELQDAAATLRHLDELADMVSELA